jgi:hypothetical protein
MRGMGGRSVHGGCSVTDLPVDRDLRNLIMELVRLRRLAYSLAWLLLTNILVTGLSLAMAVLGR